MHDEGRGSAHWMWGRNSDQAELGTSPQRGSQILRRHFQEEVGTTRRRGLVSLRKLHMGATGEKEPQSFAQGEGAGPGLHLRLVKVIPLGDKTSDRPNSMLSKHLLVVWLCKKLSPATQSPVRCTNGVGHWEPRMLTTNQFPDSWLRCQFSVSI